MTVAIKTSMDKVLGSRRNSAGPLLTEHQQEQRARMIERAMQCLDEDNYDGFWHRMDVVNDFVRRVRRPSPEDE